MLGQRDGAVRHQVADCRWADDWVLCSCGATTAYSPEAFADHRRAAGAKPANAGHILATPDEGMPFTPSHGPGIQVKRPGRPVPLTDICSRKHVGQWRYHGDGNRRTCKACAAELERDRREAERTRLRKAKVGAAA